MSGKNEATTLESRREFLRSALGAGVGATAVALTAHSAVAATQEAEVEAPAPKGYRLTPHIAEYYKTAAF